MDKDVTVTIGLPVYNAALYLASAIDSILAQTFTDFEIIITIDGASDNSGEIAAGYNDSRIILINEKENKGISFRINQQVSLAKGRYFARMDADDIMFPDRIEKQLEFMVQNPDIDVIGSDAIVIDDDDRLLGYRQALTHISKQTILKRILFNHPTVFGKTTWFRQNSYLTEFDGVEDFLLWNLSFSNSRFRNLNKPLHFYRDPTTVNARTYVYRQKQFRKAVWYLKSKSITGNLKTFDLIIRSYLKEKIFYMLNKTGFSDHLIRHRNVQLSEEDMAYYSNMFRNLLIGKLEN
jgi:glycosyltransferase involved in cell wall biosynthesis